MSGGGERHRRFVIPNGNETFVLNVLCHFQKCTTQIFSSLLHFDMLNSLYGY